MMDGFIKSDLELKQFIYLFSIIGSRISNKRYCTFATEGLEGILLKVFNSFLNILNIISIIGIIHHGITSKEYRLSFIYASDMICVFFMLRNLEYNDQHIIELLKCISVLPLSLSQKRGKDLTTWLRLCNIILCFVTIIHISFVVTFTNPAMLSFGLKLNNTFAYFILKLLTVVEFTYLPLSTTICSYFCCFAYMKEKHLLQNFTYVVKNTLRGNFNEHKKMDVVNLMHLLSKITKVIKDTNDHLNKINFCVICSMLANIFLVISHVVVTPIEKTHPFHLFCIIANTSVTVLMFISMIFIAANVHEEYTSMKITVFDSILQNPLSFINPKRAANMNIFLSMMCVFNAKIIVSSMHLFTLEKSVVLKTLGCAITYGVILIQINWNVLLRNLGLNQFREISCLLELHMLKDSTSA